MAIDNVAKIEVALEISKVLENIEKIQKALNNLSVKDLKVKVGAEILADVVKEADNAQKAFQGTKKAIESTNKELGKTSTKVANVSSNLSKAKRELSEFMAKHGSEIGYQDTDNYKKLVNNLRSAQISYNRFDEVVKAIKNENNPTKIANQHKEATKIVKEETEKQLSYAEQAKIKEHEMAVKYANNGYKTDSEFFRDLGDYAFLGSANDAYKRRILGAETFTFKQAIANKMREIDTQFYQDGDSYKNSARYTKDLEDLRKLQLAYKALTQDIKNLTEAKKEEIVNNAIPTYEQEIRSMRNAIQYNLRNNANYRDSKEYQDDIAYIRQLEAEWNKVKATIKGTNEEVKKVPKEAKKVTDVFKNYQSELSKIEQKASVVFHELSGKNLTTDRQVQLRQELEKLTAEYKKLNKESAAFRKQVGISSSRGFYDLNSTYDYFLAKFRSKVTAGIASQVEQFAMNAIPNFVNTMSTYQQNRVNFGQVLPNSLADNMDFMNKTMRDFIKIASDYGATVQDVVEAGRLWGRQYKDVAIVQELVRNSTKLSITDNMSLTEVNKGLEATLQQYNVHLKDANEAQQVSGHVVDTWAKLADNAIVTASDLAKANEQSAGAANQMGISFDYLNAMIATMSGATGKSGAEIGRSIRSMLVSMNTPKAQKFFDTLGIATREIGNDGVVRIRSYEKVINELMQTLQKSPKDVSKVILAMSGGRRTCPLIWEHISNKWFYIG